MNFEEYKFPIKNLKPIIPEDSRQPLVIVACGSFSPITYLHLRMFEMARDHLSILNKFQILGGYFSPVSDAYNKPGLASGKDRVKMCELALESNDWLMVDPWESQQPEFQRTAVVLDHFHTHLSLIGNIRIILLAGGDLIESFQIKGLWDTDDLHHILGDYGCCVLERTGSDTHSFLLENDILYQHKNNVYVVKQLIHNDISSSKVRLFVKREFSIKYLLPDIVAQYIYENGLFKHDNC
jgi:nicotinamide mononucleotide adenylyltransferase